MTTSPNRTIIFEGPNRAGKTTILNALIAAHPQLGREIRKKGNASITPRAALESAWNSVHAIRMMTAKKHNEDSHLVDTEDGLIQAVFDRFPLFSDPIYRPLMEGKPSVDILRHKTAMYRDLADYNTVLVLIMAPTSVLEERFSRMEPHHHVGNGEKIAAINAGYMDFAAELAANHKHGVEPFNQIPLICIQNDGNTTPEEVARALWVMLEDTYGGQL